MAYNKSLDEVEIIAALLHDVHNAHGLVFNIRALRLTQNKVRSRTRKEGLGFLTKTLPRLGKALNKALSGEHPLTATEIGFESYPGCKFPRFLGELFSKVLDSDGCLLPHPCALTVGTLQDLLFVFYKYELPFHDDQVQQVLSKFEKTEKDLETLIPSIDALGQYVGQTASPAYRSNEILSQVKVVRRAQSLLRRVFARFDPYDITPRHGPGAVATKQRLSEKFQWTNVSGNITRTYPLATYFYASSKHVFDDFESYLGLTHEDLPARVILVPKDSRGPRLISCEPVDYQWIQQGLGRAIVSHVERIELTKYNVFFTDQTPNQRGALLGSSTGRYATLDLNEASDRVSLALVRLLFPKGLVTCLESCRSSSTELPNGDVLPLNKYAPMGSSLCFPVLALVVWSILTAGAPDQDTRDGILVYGDDVVVPTAFAENAMKLLESFGLKINRDKSCTKGLFRESCGTDAFQGIKVTPVRIRTVWASSPSPEVYSSWIAYANSFYDKRYHRTYDLIVSKLLAVYGEIPSDDMQLACPSLRYVPDNHLPRRCRTNKHLQRREFYVRTVLSRPLNQEIEGWSMLLRYFTEGSKNSFLDSNGKRETVDFETSIGFEQPFSVRQYTKRGSSVLVKRWL